MGKPLYMLKIITIFDFSQYYKVQSFFYANMYGILCNKYKNINPKNKNRNYPERNVTHNRLQHLLFSGVLSENFHIHS